MANRIADRVKVTANAPGTGDFPATVSTTGFIGFNNIPSIANGDTVPYAAWDGASLWEVGVATYNSTGPVLTRTTVLVNSAGTTSPINFPSGVTIWCDAPSSMLQPFSQTTFTANGTFTTPANSSQQTVWRYRGVAGGGGGAGNKFTDAVYGAPGGGGGESIEGTFTGVAPGTAIAITVGVAGAAGLGATPTAGGNGGDTVIGAPVSITAHGGTGGPTVVSGDSSGGAGGTGSSAPVAVPGEIGGASQSWARNANASGKGGSTLWGFGPAPNSGGVGGNGGLYGAGGNGGRANGSLSPNGGTGAAGFLVIERVSG